MGSFFDSEVYEARNRFPWAEIDVGSLLRDLTQYDQPVTFTVVPRPSVATRYWYSLEWTGEDGETYGASASTLELCLWRAAVRERNTRRKMRCREKAESKPEPDFSI